MNKYALVTITTGHLYNEMAELTHPTLKAYADKIGADFIVWTDTSKHAHPGYQKLELRELLKEKYERVIFMDTDIIVRPDTPNLFEVVPEDQIGLFEEGKFVDRATGFYDFCRQVNYNPKTWDKCYYNTGVMVVSRQHVKFFDQPPEEINHFYEQTYLNVLINYHGFKVKDIGYKFNRIMIMDPFTGEERHDSFCIHYAGCSAWAEVHGGQQKLMQLIKDDLALWKEKAPDYKFKKNIAVIVGGGLGDQIAGEPVVRYIYEYLYKGDDIKVQTHWPEIFDHMKGKVTITKPGDIVENARGHYEMYTLRDPSHIVWQFMGHTIVQATDYAAICATRQQLPMKYRRIKLEVSEATIKSLEEKVGGTLRDYILLHPGRGWPSKTFTTETWQGWADALVEAGYKVAVIGKRINKDQGIVEFDMSKCLDLVDKLTVREFIATIHQSPVVITNDSSPIHIAGAFDNWLISIATCKHPDYILPYRNGGQTWRTTNLTQYPIYDDYDKRPNLVYGATLDHVDPVKLQEAMPTPKQVVDTVKMAIEKIEAGLG